MDNLFVNILFGISGLAGLYYGAEFLVRGGSTIARRAGVSPLVIGLTLVAFATSAPELVVSVDAALSGNADISIGNVVGSNIFNIAFILGICALIAPVAVKKQLLRFDAPVAAAVSLLPPVLLYMSNGILRWQGTLLFLGIIGYTVWTVRMSLKEDGGSEEQKTECRMSCWLALLFVALGFIGLVAGAKFFLWSAVYFAGLMKLSDAVIGLTIVAAGTSLPELATSIVASIKGENDIAVGNVLGSNIFNILCILGVSSMVSPMKNPELNMIDMGMMVLVTFMLLPLMRSGWRISRLEGGVFVLLYIGYMAYLVVGHV